MHQIRKRPTQDNQGQAKQTNKQTNEQASKSINRQEIHHEVQHLSSDLQRNLMRMQEFQKHVKSLQIHQNASEARPSKASKQTNK